LVVIRAAVEGEAVDYLAGFARDFVEALFLLRRWVEAWVCEESEAEGESVGEDGTLAL
jgi:hypothetical protein